MSDKPRFLLDSNVFIAAHRAYYAFDLCPGFWQGLLNQHAVGRIFSIDRVKDELQEGDALEGWVNHTLPKTCFAASTDSDVIGWYGQMVTWVQCQTQFLPAAKAEFASVADGWLIAYARAYGLILVTHEVYSKDARRRVPMPNVCRAFGVPTMNTFEMLKALGVQFN